MIVQLIRERNFTKVVIQRPTDQPATPRQMDKLHALTVEEWIEFAHPRNTERPTLAFINSPTLTQFWTTPDREQHVRNRIERIHGRRSRGRRNR